MPPWMRTFSWAAALRAPRHEIALGSLEPDLRIERRYVIGFTRLGMLFEPGPYLARNAASSGESSKSTETSLAGRHQARTGVGDRMLL